MQQIAFNFDRVTVEKIVQGAIHAVVVSVLLGLLDYALMLSGTVQSNNVFVISGMAWFAQSGYQTVRQWIAGI